MFTRELRIVEQMESFADEVFSNALDLRNAVSDIDFDFTMLKPTGLDHIDGQVNDDMKFAVEDMAKKERAAARTLKKFDVALAKLIALRAQLNY